MASLPDSSADGCFDDLPLIARDVARGITRMFFRSDLFALCEAPLPNGRRADMIALSAKGELTIVEIKVSKADLIGDQKWTDYLDYCDRFYWAVPVGFDLAPFEGGCRADPCAGLIVADRYDAEVIREAPCRPLAAPRRKAEVLRFARRAARRLAGDLDPSLAGLD
ncbi:MAG: MmcB family DNA repair protein [Sphingomonas sp.]